MRYFLPSKLDLLRLVVVMLILCGCNKDTLPKCETYSVEPTVDPSLGGTTGNSSIDTFVVAMNNYRISHGKTVLYWNSLLAVVAQGQADDMSNRNFFDHTNPDGKDPSQRLRDANLFFVANAENLLAQAAQANPTTSANQALAGWEASPPHNAALLDQSNLGWVFTAVGKHASSPNCSATGITAPCEYWVQLFWNPGCSP